MDYPLMDKSKLRLILRISLLALWASVVLSIALAFLQDKLLPDALVEWHKSSAGQFGFGDIVALLFWGLGLFLFFVSSIGLFFYQRWAAWMFTIVTAVFSLQLLASPTVEPGISSFIGSWSDVLTGMVIALVFFTDVLREDNHTA
jgi:multisubunit Na+/H+ antiporter MnhG subunit